MLPPTNFGRCVAVKIGAEKVAINPPQMADAQADGPETHTIGPSPERTWAQYLAQMRRAYNRGGLGGVENVIATDAHRQRQQRVLTGFGGQSTGDPYATNAAVETLSNPKERETFLSGMRQRMSDFYDWGSTPIGTDAYAKKNNLSHLPRQEQAAEYLRHLDAQNSDAARRGQLLHQRIDRAGEDLVSFVNDPETRTRTMAALGSGSILPAWWPSWAGGEGAEAQRKQIEAAQAVTPADVQLQTELFNETPIAKTVEAGRDAAKTGFKSVRDEFGRIGDDLSTPGSTLLGSLGRSAQRIGGAARQIDTGFDPVAWGAQARKQLGWDTAQQQQTAPPPPPQSNFWNDAKRTMADSGKKLQELMRDPTFAAAIAVPTLGLGAYGIYDLLRNKKRRKRPKFYDENAREF